MDFWNIPLLLAVVATLGYLMGCRRVASADDTTRRSQRELRRAQQVAGELEKISHAIRQGLSAHHASVNRFKQRVGRLSDAQTSDALQELCREAEAILEPTMQLAAQISHAYESLRQQSAHLMTFTEVRTDPLTGARNRRGLDDAMAAQFAMMIRYDTHFAVAMFDADHFKAINDAEGHLVGDRMLQELAQVFDESVRETDIVARYGGEEFLVVMPQTDLAGACVFAERLRSTVERRMRLTISGGVAEALDGDTAESLLARTDAALYEAKGGGRNRVYSNDGERIEPVTKPLAAAKPLELAAR
jgi:diguanylate cyclase (GGDEF)-like protein